MAKQFLKVFLPLTALVGAGLLISYQMQTNLSQREIANTERREMELKAASFANRFSMVRIDLMLLAKQQELQSILNPARDLERVRQFREALAKEYLVLSVESRQYDQIRFIDDIGKEVVRVNFNRGRPSVVPDHLLQDQHRRYWFKDAIGLQKGDVFVSPLDLNIDFGRIEQPLKPMIRFATPVFDVKGRKRGIVVLNYLAEVLLKDLSAQHSQSSGSLLLLNAEGYWLKGLRPADEWGFMYDTRRDRTFAKAFPQVWQRIHSQKTGQFQAREGLFTFTTIYPLLGVQGAESSTGSGYVFGASQARVSAESYAWKLVTYVPTDILDKRSQTVRDQLLLLFVAITGFIAINYWLLLRVRIMLQHSEQRTRELKKAKAEAHHLLQVERELHQQSQQAAIVAERNRMARDIHDSLAQSLTGVVMQLNAATEFLTSQPQQAQACITRAQDLAKQGLTEARRSVWMLYQSDPTLGSLANSLTQLIEQMATGSDIIINLRIEGTPYSLEPPVKLNLLRIAQESLTNAIRHANPKTIRLQLLYTPQQIQLRVQDDGAGFDPHQTAAEQGFGLIGMSDRAKVIGAHLQIQSTIGVGTEISVTVPISS